MLGRVASRICFDMPLINDDFIEEFFQGLAETVTCDWCRHPWERDLRSGLCSHCYYIKRQLRKAERNGGDGYKVALRKSQLARSEGLLYGDIHKKDISALDLEHAFIALSRLLGKKRMFFFDANSIGRALPSPQRMYVFYLLSLLMRAHLRQNRSQMARRETQGIS